MSKAKKETVNKESSEDARKKIQTAEHKQEAMSNDVDDDDSQEERNGIIPDDMDFRKFIGCGG